MRNLRNLDVGTQSQDPENAQRNLEITQIPRLRKFPDYANSQIAQNITRGTGAHFGLY